VKRLALVALLPTLMLPSYADATSPVPTTLYMHGSSALGEQDGVNWVASTFTESALTLSATKPTGDSKSMSYAGMVNDVCTGVPLYPTFAGKLNGTIAGPVRLTLSSLSAPGTYTARIWTDADIFQCNADYSPPVAEAEFDVPAGESTVKVDLPIASPRDRDVSVQLTVMVYAPTIPAYRGQVGRLRYDGVTTPSGASFVCTPRRGHKTCLS
jgi:hypothetical protein